MIFALVISTPLKGEPAIRNRNSHPLGVPLIVSHKMKLVSFIGQTIGFGGKGIEFRFVIVQFVLHKRKLNRKMVMVRVRLIKLPTQTATLCSQAANFGGIKGPPVAACQHFLHTTSDVLYCTLMRIDAMLSSVDRPKISINIM